MNEDFLNLFPEEIRDSVRSLYRIVIERAVLRVYQDLDDEGRQELERVFISGTEEDQENYLNQTFPNLKDILLEETKKLLEELKK
ncbi:MAG: hypothetical protein BWY48_00389 [Parcubacteria group bacterium ADurb.Bin305]|jgi:hypothetical protein|nr:hypothetical protein [Candidatus Paceibacterota bacterium]MDD3434863.1 hypothetical protein [Candidatus Paceibacterota bacterium]OQA43858.1 MAG: hypothetical protein BWY48_00389 [Parcubacteria group bacterium ADurb.Bin305]